MAGGEGPPDRAAPGPVAGVGAHDAVVLAGGRAQRLGGLDKARLVVAGRSLLEQVLTAVGGARAVAVVGPVEIPDLPGAPPTGVVLEDPPDGGPAAGLAAGLGLLGSSPAAAPWVLVVAVDQPGVGAVVPLLLSALADGPDADLCCPVDASGRSQWLLAAYRREALDRRLAELGDLTGASVRSVVRGLRAAEVPVAPEHLGDIDTPADLRRWRARPAGTMG